MYDDDGAAYWEHAMLSGKARYSRTPDRERGARKRLQAIITGRNQRVITATPEPPTIDQCADKVARLSVAAYIQTDPRGAALYILRPGDVPEGKDPGSYYDRGICVY